MGKNQRIEYLIYSVLQEYYGKWKKKMSYRVNVYSMLQWYTILLKDAYAPLVENTQYS